MIEHPFSLLRPFQDQLRIAMFVKADDIERDRSIAEKWGVPDIAALHQVHGNRAIRVRGPIARTEQADAMATDTKKLILTIRTADCQNLIVFEPTKNVIGVIHAGWRGVESHIIASFYRLLREEWNIDPKDTYVVAGPSLGFECAEFTDPAKELPSVPTQFIQGRLVDLSGAADQQLMDLGVRPERIQRMKICTKCHPDEYWTYRGGDREAVMAGKTNVLACVLI